MDGWHGPRQCHDGDMNVFTSSSPAPLTTAGIAVAPSGRVAALSAGRSEAWTTAINHRFVNELFSGELDDAQLTHYVIQDNQFFVPFLELLGEALVRADTVEAKLVFGRQLGMICSEESGWFEATFDELGVSQADRAHPQLSEPTRTFENLMHEAVNTHHYPTVLVLLVVAEGLYLDWASRTDAPEPGANLPNKFLGWVDLHRGDEFRTWVQFLVDELERASGQVDLEELTRFWNVAVDLELAFFNDVPFPLEG